jgi:hypothetical protein
METFGTTEYYAAQFADFIADLQHDTPDRSDNLVAGFKLAIDDWRKYHSEQVLELDRIKQKLND